MRWTRTTGAVALAVALALPSAATAATAPTGPTLRTEGVWFACDDEAPVQNVAYLQGRTPGWTTTAPTGSVRAGAGCGAYENAVGGWLGPNRTSLDTSWAGTFTGNVDSITVALHNAHVSRARALGTFPVRVTLRIDGVDVCNCPEEGDLVLTPAADATGVSDRMTFTLTDIGLVVEDGDGARERRYEIVVRSLSEEQSGWVWGAAEVPAGVTFNPAQPEATTVAVR